MAQLCPKKTQQNKIMYLYVDTSFLNKKQINRQKKKEKNLTHYLLCLFIARMWKPQSDFNCAATPNFLVSEITKKQENNQYVLAINCSVLLFPLYHNN